MSKLEYQYSDVFGIKSQCQQCHHDTCKDVGKGSLFDGMEHICSRFEPHTKERREEIARDHYSEWIKAWGRDLIIHI